MAFRWQSRLGITLAVDDRTRQPLTQARRNLAELGHGADATGGAFGRMSREIGRTAASLRAVERAFDVTKLAETQAFRLDRALSNVTLQIGGAAEQAQAMGGTVLHLANATGASVEQVGGLAVALAATGQQLESGDEQLVNLVRHFGMSAESAAMFRKQAGQLGTSVASLTETTVQLQDNFNMPGMLAELPKVTDFAQRMFGQFSRSVLGNERRVIEQTLETGAVLASAFGKPFGRALDDAQQSMEFLAQTADQDTRFFMGLERDLSGLSQTLATFMGPRMNEAFRARSQGPIAFAGRLRHELARMESQFGKNHLLTKAFASELQRNLPEAMRRLVFNQEAWTDALEAQRVAQEHARGSIGEGTTSFDKMTSALSSVGSTAIETFKNLLTLGKTVVGLTFASDVGDIFTTVNKKLKEFNTYILDLANNLKDNERFKRFREGLRSIGPVVVGITTGIGVLGSALTSLSALTGMWRPMQHGLRMVGLSVDGISKPLLFLPRLVGTVVTKVAYLLPHGFRTALNLVTVAANRFAGSGGIISRILGGLTARVVAFTNRFAGGGLYRIVDSFAKVSIGSLVKGVFSAVLAFKSIGVALNEFGKVLRDPNKTGLEKFKGFVRATFTGVADFVNTILLGIPSMITQALGLGTFQQVIGGWGEDIANFFTADGPSRLGAAIDSFKSWMTEQIKGAVNYLLSPEFQTSVTEAGKNIGVALGWMLNEITNPENWKALWGKVVAFFTEPSTTGELTGALQDMLIAVWVTARNFTSTVADGILGQLGTSIDEMKGVFADLWTAFSEKASNAFNALKPLIMATILRPMALVNDKAAETLAQWEAEQQKAEEQEQERQAAIQMAASRGRGLDRVTEQQQLLQERVAEYQQEGRSTEGLLTKIEELQRVQNLLNTATAPTQIDAAMQMLEQLGNVSSFEEAFARIAARQQETTRQGQQAAMAGDVAGMEAVRQEQDELRRLATLVEAARNTESGADDVKVFRRVRDEVAVLGGVRRRTPAETAAAAGNAAPAPAPAAGAPAVLVETLAATLRPMLAGLQTRNYVELGPRASELFTQQRNNDDRRGLGE